MTVLEEVSVVWYGPYTHDTVVDHFHDDEDFGVYMITRRIGSYAEKILYIGITYARTFAKRLKEHSYWLSDLRGKVKVRLGYLKEKRPSYQRLRDVESLLLFVCEPEYNETGTRTYLGRTLRIVNSGRKGPLDRIAYSEDYSEE